MYYEAMQIMVWHLPTQQGFKVGFPYSDGRHDDYEKRSVVGQESPVGRTRTRVRGGRQVKEIERLISVHVLFYP